jgi:hypothetical protein
MDDKKVIEIARVMKEFVTAHSPSPPGSGSPHSDPLPEEASIWQLTSAKEWILALSDQNQEVTQAFYEAMVAMRSLYISHKVAVKDLAQNHEDVLAAHKQKIAGNARNTFHRFCPILNRFLRGEIQIEQARTDILDAIDPSLRDGEMANDLASVLEEANAFRTAHEELGGHMAIVAAYVNASRALRKMVP